MYFCHRPLGLVQGCEAAPPKPQGCSRPNGFVQRLFRSCLRPQGVAFVRLGARHSGRKFVQLLGGSAGQLSDVALVGRTVGSNRIPHTHRNRRELQAPLANSSRRPVRLADVEGALATPCKQGRIGPASIANSARLFKRAIVGRSLCRSTEHVRPRLVSMRRQCAVFLPSRGRRRQGVVYSGTRCAFTGALSTHSAHLRLCSLVSVSGFFGHCAVRRIRPSAVYVKSGGAIAGQYSLTVCSGRFAGWEPIKHDEPEGGLSWV